jgi:hypothetical protein
MRREKHENFKEQFRTIFLFVMARGKVDPCKRRETGTDT